MLTIKERAAGLSAGLAKCWKRRGKRAGSRLIWRSERGGADYQAVRRYDACSKTKDGRLIPFAARPILEFMPDPVCYIRCTDGSRRPVYEDERGQYVVNDDGQ